MEKQAISSPNKHEEWWEFFIYIFALNFGRSKSFFFFFFLRMHAMLKNTYWVFLFLFLFVQTIQLPHIMSSSGWPLLTHTCLSKACPGTWPHLLARPINQHKGGRSWDDLNVGSRFWTSIFLRMKLRTCKYSLSR